MDRRATHGGGAERSRQIDARNVGPRGVDGSARPGDDWIAPRDRPSLTQRLSDGDRERPPSDGGCPREFHPLIEVVTTAFPGGAHDLRPMREKVRENARFEPNSSFSVIERVPIG